MELANRPVVDVPEGGVGRGVYAVDPVGVGVEVVYSVERVEGGVGYEAFLDFG